MKGGSFILKIGLFSLALVAGGRLVVLTEEAHRETELTDTLCGAVGNYLETNAVRNAYEAFEYGVRRSGYPEACVSIISDINNYAPNCADPARSYHTTLCRVQGNQSIHGEVLYPVAPFISFEFFLIWSALWSGIILILNGIQSVLNISIQKLSEEFQNQLFGDQACGELEPKDRTSAMGRWVDLVVTRLGLMEGLKRQALKFEARIRDYEIRIRDESALRAKKEAESEKAKEYVGRMRQIRHDIRSPLSTLYSLREKFQTNIMASRALSSTITGIQKMIDDLSHFQGAAEERKLVLLEVIASESINAMRGRFLSAKSITLTLEYDPDGLSPVMAIPEPLRRVLDNLLENAFDAAPVGGSVRAYVHCEHQKAVIEIEDNGPGVAPTALGTLFQEGATHGKVNGSGFGLSYAKRTIESWGGAINYEPLSPGSRFVIRLPSVQVGVSFVGPLGLGPVAVIDDDPAVSQALSTIGLEVVASAGSATEGRELIDRYQGQDIAVLIDQHLGPQELGSDLIARGVGLTRTYLCTHAYDDPQVIQRAKVLGVRIVPKPLCFLAPVFESNASSL
jgi:signal transduction histidine kinase